MEEYSIYCGGKFIQTSHSLEVRNPYDNGIIAMTYLASPPDLEAAIISAGKVLEDLKNMPSYKRYEILMKIAAQLADNRDRLALVLAREAAKPLRLAAGEVERGIQTFVAAAEEAKRLPKEYISIDWTKPGENKEGLIKYFPLGIIAGISPFNFPLNLAVHKIAPAIASGNAIILKPARSTPLSVLELARIIDNTELPKGAVSILPMDRECGNKLVTDDRIKLLTFTGSSEVGWKMKAECGKKKIALELGGNAGAIITPSANIDIAVNKCLAGSFAFSGQVCIHLQRIYVHESIFEDFTGKLVQRTLQMKAGAPDDPATDISSMIDVENAERVEEWLSDAISDGAMVLCGGQRNGTFFQPTIVTSTKSSMKLSCMEIFGPVVIVEKYSDYGDAIQRINETEYGLQAGVFTNDISEMNRAFNEIEAGGVMINEVPTFRVDHMPYGGIKNSGAGREGIKYSILEMMEPRLLVKDII